jgi:hypothetical protein
MTELSRTRRAAGAVPIGRGLRWAPVGPDPAGRPRYTQGALALSFALQTGLDAEPGRDVLSVVADPSCAEPVSGLPPAPDPQPWAARFLQAVVEVVASQRPLSQLARWTDSDVYAEISGRRSRVADRHADAGSRSGRRVVASVRICRPWPDVAEVAARVTAGGRSRAIAARLDYVRGRWLCTAIDFG